MDKPEGKQKKERGSQASAGDATCGHAAGRQIQGPLVGAKLALWHFEKQDLRLF